MIKNEMKALVRPAGLALLGLALTLLVMAPDFSVAEAGDRSDSWIRLFPREIASRVQALGPTAGGGTWVALHYWAGEQEHDNVLKLLRIGQDGAVEKELSTRVPIWVSGRLIPRFKDGNLYQVVFELRPPDLRDNVIRPSTLHIIQINQQEEIEAEKSIPAPDLIDEVVPLTDGYLLLSIDMQNQKAWAIRIGVDAEKRWERGFSLPFSADRSSYLCSAIPDGEDRVFITIGEPFNEEFSSLAVLIDGDGNLIWERKIADWRLSFARHGARTSDDEFLIADRVVMRLDPNGDTRWVNSLPELTTDEGTSLDARGLFATDDGGCIVIFRVSNLYGAGEEKLAFVRLDRDGKVVALKTHHYAEVTWSVITSEGGLLVAGTMNSPVLLGAWTETAALVLKLDPNLETVWETRLRIDGSMNGQDGFETAEGDCLAAGTYGFDLMTGHDRPWLAKLDREGKLNDPEYKKAQVRGVPHLVSNSLLEAMIFSIFMFQGFLVP